MEKLIKNKCKFIYDIDFFGKEPELYYKGKEKNIMDNHLFIFWIICYNIYL